MPPDMAHDTGHHAEMLEARMLPDSVCSATGLSQHTLKKMGSRLTVDRIDSAIGYVPGNCVLLAESLNTAKGQGSYIPQSAIDRLFYRAAKLRKSRHDKV